MSLLEELHRRFQPEVPLGHEHPEWYQPRTDTNVRETLRRALFDGR